MIIRAVTETMKRFTVKQSVQSIEKTIILPCVPPARVIIIGAHPTTVIGSTTRDRESSSSRSKGEGSRVVMKLFVRGIREDICHMAVTRPEKECVVPCIVGFGFPGPGDMKLRALKIRYAMNATRK